MTVMMMMTRWTMLLRGLVITCVSAFVSGWMHSWGTSSKKGFHQKHKYIIANIFIKSTNISSLILSSKAQISSPILSVLLNGKPASNCMNLVPAVQHISGSQLFKLNQKLALIMNLLTLWSEDRETLWNRQTFIFFPNSRHGSPMRLDFYFTPKKN